MTTSIKYYILKILEKPVHLGMKEDIEIIDIISTQGNIGIYVRYYVVDHFTGALINSKTQAISNNLIIREFDRQNYKKGTNLKYERMIKLNRIKLKLELKNNKTYNL